MYGICKKRCKRDEEVCKEICEISRIGLTKFQALAKEANAVYKVDGIALVNCEIFEKYLETFRVYDNFDWS